MQAQAFPHSSSGGSSSSTTTKRPTADGGGDRVPPLPPVLPTSTSTSSSAAVTHTLTLPSSPSPRTPSTSSSSPDAAAAAAASAAIVLASPLPSNSSPFPFAPAALAKTTRKILSSASSIPPLIFLLSVLSLPIIAAHVPRLLHSSSSQSGRRGALSHPPSCQPSLAASAAAGTAGGAAAAAGGGAEATAITATGLPTLFFIAGVEGSGHRRLASLFELMHRGNVSFTQDSEGDSNEWGSSSRGANLDLHLTWDEGQVFDMSSAGLKRWRGCPKLPYARQVYDLGVQITARFAQLQEQPGVAFQGEYVLAGDTFPMGPIRTPLARPDLVGLALFHGIMYRLKVLVIVPDVLQALAATLMEGVHVQDEGLQRHLLEDALTYLDASLRSLPCGSYAALRLDSLIPSPTAPATGSSDAAAGTTSGLVAGSADTGSAAAASASGLDDPRQTALAESLASFLAMEGIGPREMLGVLEQMRSLWVKPNNPTQLPSTQPESAAAVAPVPAPAPANGTDPAAAAAAVGGGEGGLPAGEVGAAATKAVLLTDGDSAERFFEQREGLWPLLSQLAESQRAFFSPTSPADWP